MSAPKIVPGWAAFGEIVKQHRKYHCMSSADIERMTRLSSGQLCWLEQGRTRVREPMMRLLAAILDIPLIDIWIIAVHGIKGPICFGKAYTIYQLLELQAPDPPDVSKRLAMLKPLLVCNRCNHVWRQAHQDPPERCPDCRCKHYNEPWTEEREKVYQRYAKFMKKVVQK